MIFCRIELYIIIGKALIVLQVWQYSDDWVGGADSCLIINGKPVNCMKVSLLLYILMESLPINIDININPDHYSW
jgi:hypothetical protein